jgi:uncharacterized coiled-coil DUF342 family protein
MVKFNKKIFGGYNTKEVDEKVNQQIKTFDVEKQKLYKQVNELLQQNIELAQKVSILNEEVSELKESNKQLEISNNNYKTTLLRQINNISKESNYKSHSNNRKKVILKYKEEKSI